MVAGDNIDKN